MFFGIGHYLKIETLRLLLVLVVLTIENWITLKKSLSFRLSDKFRFIIPFRLLMLKSLEDIISFLQDFVAKPLC